jgi:hypothetical protein
VILMTLVDSHKCSYLVLFIYIGLKNAIVYIKDSYLP